MARPEPFHLVAMARDVDRVFVIHAAPCLRRIPPMDLAVNVRVAVAK